ncbi:MAG: hypothetical protein WCW66_04680 [Patescibacteria group bacterium]
MEKTLTFQNSLFWNKLGKYQVLAVVLVLAVFFITLQVGDKERAFTACAIAALAFTVFALFFAGTFAAFAAFSSAACAPFICAVYFAVYPCAPLLSAEFRARGIFVFSALIAFVSFIADVIVCADGMERYNEARKEAVWLSLITESVVVLLLLMLLAH